MLGTKLTYSIKVMDQNYNLPKINIQPNVHVCLLK